ncbi:MAG: beta-propeller domain-containing protein [Myxococcota bacterium]
MRTRHFIAVGLLVAALPLACFSDSKPALPTLSARTRTSAALHNFDDCDGLTAALRQSLREEMRTRLVQMANQDWYWRGGMVMTEDSGSASPTSDSASGATPRVEGVDFSGTNNQEGGVDEADFVKTDGYYLYVLNGNKLEILGVPQVGELTTVGAIDIAGWPTELLLDGDTATVFSSVYLWGLDAQSELGQALVTDRASTSYPVTSLTKVTVVDLANRGAPQVTREIYLEGYYQTAREVEGSVRMVSYAWLDIPGLIYWPEVPSRYYDVLLTDSDRERLWREAIIDAVAKNDAIIAALPLDAFVPRIYERASDGSFVVRRPTAEAGCTNFAMADDAVSHGVTSIISMDLRGATFTYESDHILSNWSTVYASQSTLLIAEPAQDWWWYWNADGLDEATNVHRFDISVAGATTYTGSGRVPGTVLGQFALSESAGDVRVASTTGQWNRWWMENPTPPDNHVFVLRGATSLETLGHVGGIGTGEQLWSSRFVGDKAYLVTFRNVDPLWTIDLSDPSAPAIVGELTVPGVSTYIHPLDGDELLTIGFGGNSEALDWSTQVSLFDVSDFAHPQVDDVLSLAPELDPNAGWSWSWSEATYQHKAFQYWAPLGLLAVPLSTYRNFYTEGPEYAWGYEYRSRLQLVRVDPIGGTLSLFADVDHSSFFNDDPSRYWDWRDVRRSIFMHDSTTGSDYVYAISDRGVTAHEILADGVTERARVALPGTDTYQLYWGMVD